MSLLYSINSMNYCLHYIKDNKKPLQADACKGFRFVKYGGPSRT